MKNYGDKNFFKKEITIVNGNSKKNNKIDLEKISLQFFPESGNFLAGIENTIAFKAVNQQGKGISIEGKIYDANDNFIIDFKSTHIGMGKFNITPKYGVNYKAVLSENFYFELPEVINSGFLFKVINKRNNIMIVISRRDSVLNDTSKKIHLIIKSRGQINFAAQGNIINSCIIDVDKNRLLNGINQITLFDESGIPQSERLIFINNKDSLQVRLNLDKETYQKRKEVEIDISVLKNKLPISSNFSLSIYDSDKIRNHYEYPIDIQNHLLLSSDLTGLIENPGYYFKDRTIETQNNADLLMMTQGWRRFSWQKILHSNPKKLTYMNEKGIPISGHVFKTIAINSPSINSTIKILDSNGSYMELLTDSMGYFYSERLLFSDTTELIIQTENANGKKRALRLDLAPRNQTPEITYATKMNSSTNTEAFISYINKKQKVDSIINIRFNGILLDEVTIRDLKIENGDLLKKYYTERATNSLKMDDILATTPNVIDALTSGKVAGIRASAGTGGVITPYIYLRGKSIPSLFIDNQRVDIQTFIDYPIELVESINIFKGTAAFTILGASKNGAIVVFTRKDQMPQKPPIGINIIKYRGFYLAKNFYSPRYNNDEVDSFTPDYRTTLYWNPNINSDSDGKAKLTFYTSDITSTYKIQLEGISKDGTPLVHTSEFTVE